MAGRARGLRIASVLDEVDRVYAAARAVCADDETAAAVTTQALRAGRSCAVAARLAARRAPHPAYARMDADDREAVVLARALGWTTDHIAAHLGISEADVKRRLARGLRTLLPPRDCAAAASPAHAGRGS